MNDTEIIKDFDELLHCFISIGNKLDGSRIPEGQELLYNAEGLGQKIVHHTLTIRVLYDGYQLNGFVPTVDFASIGVLARSVFETYLVFHYLFVEEVSADEKEFRIQSWYLGGLDRIKYEPAFEDNMEQWEKEKGEAEALKVKIRATEKFQQLDPQIQKKILKGKWQYIPWFEMAIKAGFTEQYFRQLYMFMSSYAHANRLSIIQIQQLKKIEEQKDIAAGFVAIILPVIAKYIFDYVQIMPGLTDSINLDDPELRLIKLYKIVGESMGSQ
jgi:hypothetical protein